MKRLKTGCLSQLAGGYDPLEASHTVLQGHMQEEGKYFRCDGLNIFCLSEKGPDHYSPIELCRVRRIKYITEFKSERSRKISHYLERGGIIIFVLAVVAALSHVSMSSLGHDFNVEWIEHGLTFAALVLPAVGAAIGGIRTHREYTRIERRSGNMEELTLRETQDWLMLMKFTELEAAP